MVNPTLQDAICEAYASAPSDVVIFELLEIRHSKFEPIRVVNQYQKSVKVVLESTAPVDANKEVEFFSYPFKVSLPPISDNGLSDVTITIDNVTNEISQSLDKAVETQEVIKVTYRRYLSTDLKSPQLDPPYHLTLSDISFNGFSISGRASFGNLENTSFPDDRYTPKRFPSLTW